MANQLKKKITREMQDNEYNEAFIQRMKRAIYFNLTFLKIYCISQIRSPSTLQWRVLFPILQVKRVCPIYPGLQNWEKIETFWFPSSMPACGRDQALGWETKDWSGSCTDELYQVHKVKFECSCAEYFLELPVKIITCKQKQLQAEARLWAWRAEARRFVLFLCKIGMLLWVSCRSFHLWLQPEKRGGFDLSANSCLVAF